MYVSKRWKKNVLKNGAQGYQGKFGCFMVLLWLNKLGITLTATTQEHIHPKEPN